MNSIESAVAALLNDAAQRIEVRRDLKAVETVTAERLFLPQQTGRSSRVPAVMGAAAAIAIAVAGLWVVANRGGSPRSDDPLTSVPAESLLHTGIPVVTDPPEWAGDFQPTTYGPISNQPAAYAVLADLDPETGIAEHPVLLIVDGSGDSCDPDESLGADGSGTCVHEAERATFVRSLISPGGTAIGDASISRLTNIAQSVSWTDLGDDQPFSYSVPGAYSITTDAVLIAPVERPGLSGDVGSRQVDIVNVSDFGDPLIALLAFRPGGSVTATSVAGAKAWCSDLGLAWSPGPGAVVLITSGFAVDASPISCEQYVELAETITLPD